MKVKRADLKLKSILYSSPMVIIMILTLLLLTYVGFGEANRKYTVFQLQKLKTQGEIVKNAFDNYLKAGLPLTQFSGFASASELLLKSDKAIGNIRVLDTNQNIVFFNSQSHTTQFAFEKRRAQKSFEEIKIGNKTSTSFKVEESQESFQISQSLKSKFGIVGHVIIEAPKQELLSYLNDQYFTVFYVFIGLSVAFFILVVVYELIAGNKKIRQRLYQSAYLFCFLTMSTVIGLTVFNIYEEGAKASTKALSDSMTQRLGEILELGIEIKQIKGINEAFRQYKASNPDINAIAVTEGNITISHTNANLIGTPYTSPEASLEYINTLNGYRNGEKKIFRVAVSMPTDVITNAILDSSKAFLVLFIACGLISLIFLNAGSSILEVISRDSYDADKEKSLSEIIEDICDDGIIIDEEKERLAAKLHEHPKLNDEEQHLMDDYYQRLEDGSLIEKNRLDVDFDIGLNLIKPAYFLIVFVNALSISFLPQLVSELAEKTGSSIAGASLPFTIYYLLFAFVLIPAGQYAEKGNLKKLMAFGFLAEVVGLTLVAMSGEYWLLTLGRAASGIGQGLFLIGLQSYVLAVTPKGKRSIGHAVKVIGRNSGLIAGTAIGALLYSYIDYSGVFMLASIISLSALFYLGILVPGVEKISGAVTTEAKVIDPQKENAFLTLFKNIIAVIKNSEFMKTLLTIGIVGKMSIAGVVMFAIPLLLTKKGFATEDIGLALMLYYISGMLTTHFATKVVDAPGATRWVLSISAVIGGLSSLFLGFIGISKLIEQASIPGITLLSYLAVGFNTILAQFGIVGIDSYLILFFIVLIGVSNGLLAAPIMTHIGNTEIADKRGVKTVSATYVFMERFGHVTGPAVISLLITVNNGSTLAISFFGVITIALGCLFAIISRTYIPEKPA